MGSRQRLTRPKTSTGLPAVRRSIGAVTVGDGEPAAGCSPARPGTRLPELRGHPCLSRQPQRLWTEGAPGGGRKLLGNGAFGRVFQATFAGRLVAVKEVGGDRARSRAGSSRDRTYEREARGAKFLLDLKHENVVRYLQFDTYTPGVLYIVMELIEGKNLCELRRRGPLSVAQIRSVLSQTCSGLHYLHSRRPPIVHRDVKGSNIMVTHDDRVKLVDLGLAIVCHECQEQGDGTQNLTRRSLAGTHRFLAPEVYERQAYSPKSDVFALGCAAYELQSGRPPHDDKSNDMAVCYAVTHQPMPEMPSGCDRCLAQLYASCTSREPEDRPSALELAGHKFFIILCA